MAELAEGAAHGGGGREEEAEGKAERDGGREHGDGTDGAGRALAQPGALERGAGGRGEPVETGGAAARLSSSPGV